MSDAVIVDTAYTGGAMSYRETVSQLKRNFSNQMLHGNIATKAALGIAEVEQTVVRIDQVHICTTRVAGVGVPTFIGAKMQEA